MHLSRAGVWAENRCTQKKFAWIYPSNPPSLNSQNWWASSRAKGSSNYAKWQSPRPASVTTAEESQCYFSPNCRFSSWTRKSMPQSWISCFELQSRQEPPAQWSSSPIKPGGPSRSVPTPSKSQVLSEVWLKYVSSWHKCSSLQVGAWSCVELRCIPSLPCTTTTVPSSPACWEETSIFWAESSLLRTKLPFICQGLGLESGLLRPAQGLWWRYCPTASRSQAGTGALPRVSVGLNWNPKQRTLSTLHLSCSCLLSSLNTHYYFILLSIWQMGLVCSWEQETQVLTLINSKSRTQIHAGQISLVGILWMVKRPQAVVFSVGTESTFIARPAVCQEMRAKWLPAAEGPHAHSM